MTDVLAEMPEGRENGQARELLAALGRVVQTGDGQLLAMHVLERLGVGRIIGASETEITGRNLGIDALRFIMEAPPGAGLNILAGLFARTGRQ